jgi:hypothetical protein
MAMQTHISKLALSFLGVALLAGAFSSPAAADLQYRDNHHRIAHRTHRSADANYITVRKHIPREPVAVAPDAFHGPAAIITAPVEIAGTIVSLPFRVVDAVFPPRANDPRVLVGAPVHFAGQIAEFPFFAFNGAFGVQPTYYTYN